MQKSLKCKQKTKKCLHLFPLCLQIRRKCRRNYYRRAL
nr:MAG TPA: hypothetical protein [Caudoviricetes sp.]